MPRNIITAAVTLLVGVTQATAQDVPVGAVQTLKVVSVSLHVGGGEKDTRRVTYTPPPGWYVRAHAVEVGSRYGQASYTVSTVPASWEWTTGEHTRESLKQSAEAAVSAQGPRAQAKLVQQRDGSQTSSRQARASHHALVVEAAAKGEGYFRSGAGVELTVTAELVYVGDAPAGVALGR